MIKIFFSDIDGTILNDYGEIPQCNKKALEKLQNEGLVSVLATGRNFMSAHRVIEREKIKVDYLIFSTGMGIQNIQTDELMDTFDIPVDIANSLIDRIKTLGVNFFVHFPLPINHRSYYHKVYEHSDFNFRLFYYEEFTKPLPPKVTHPISQIIIIMQPDYELANQVYKEIKYDFPELSYIYTSSPNNYNDIWLEIFPPSVSKGLAVKKLCDYLGLSTEEAAAIGNDFNDESMLDTVGHPYIVANAPDELKMKYKNLPSNHNCGFTFFADSVLQKIKTVD